MASRSFSAGAQSRMERKGGKKKERKGVRTYFWSLKMKICPDIFSPF
jgi:hypothetical protein